MLHVKHYHVAQYAFYDVKDYKPTNKDITADNQTAGSVSR